MIKNYGYVSPVITDDHWQYGSSPLSQPDILDSGDWRPFLPTAEVQTLPDSEDPCDCTVAGSQNQLKVLLKFLSNIEHNFDERYTYNDAWISPPGANPQLAYESLRKEGVTEGVLPITNTLAEFMLPRPLTSDIISKGQAWGYQFNHQWLFSNNPSRANRVELLRIGLKKSPIAVSVTAWSQDENGLYIDNGQPNCHWCVCVGMDGDSPIIFDSYIPALKKLHPDHHIEVAKMIAISPALTDAQKKTIWQVLVELLKDGLGNFFPAFLEKYNSSVIKSEPSNDYQQVKQAVMTPTLDEFCNAIRDYEGKPGDLNYKNNNPGNCRCSPVGYKSIYGNVKCVNNFAVFTTYDLGFLYLKNLITEKIKENPTWTILNYISNHAPASDGNDPKVYANWIANKLGVPVTTKVSTFLTT